jgi:hypothetical protein
MGAGLRTPALAVLLLAGGCTADSQDPGSGNTPDRLGVWVPEPGTTILQSEQSSLHVPTFAVVVDTGTWRSIWSRTWADVSSTPNLPFEDFVLTSVFVLGLGDRAGAGYSVTIDSLVSYSSGQILYATEYKPVPPCPGPALLTAPVHMVRVPNHPPLMEHRISVVPRHCPPS